MDRARGRCPLLGTRRVECDAHGERRIRGYRDRKPTHVRHDSFEATRRAQGPDRVSGHDDLAGRGRAGGEACPQALIGAEPPGPGPADAGKVRDLRDERSQYLARVALTAERTERARMHARPDGLEILPPERPDDLRGHESDRDQRLDRPEIGRARLVAAQDQRRVIAHDRERGRGYRADRSRAEGGRADRERIEDPGRELEREREDESSDGDKVDGRRERRHPPRRREEAEHQSRRQIEQQHARGERQRACAAEEDKGAAEGDRREPDEQVSTLACLVDRCGAPHLRFSNASGASRSARASSSLPGCD